jgi:hypothetical protein
MGVSGQCHTPAALYLREKTPGTHCTRGWVGPRVGLDREVRGKIICLCRESNLDSRVVQSVARHYQYQYEWGVRTRRPMYRDHFLIYCASPSALFRQ